MNCTDTLQKKISLMILIGMLGVLAPSIMAQTTINATGGSQAMADGTFYYSIGEMTVISTQSNTGLTVTQGLLQIESDYLGVRQPVFTGQELTIFPNPANNILHISPKLHQSGELHLKLYNLQGRLIKSKTVHLHTGGEKQTLNLSAVQEATYLLNVDFDHGKTHYHQTFKIIKHTN